ncbi:hypothetical protein LPJ53_001240 [Coemansia erecta]|uniref:Transcription elongation factor Eaf N-terminal domain-containing protein n=1 Tax=Coemansia erecta TaxID=147472 RepID=A0A9W7Y6T8_9FUNG|nr:hypothetical protein LPJ53_001240 [Coemansia erecta]
MSLNLDQQTTYSLHAGSSLQSSDSSGDASQFHMVSRHLPRATTKLSREILDSGTGLRTRLANTASQSSSSSPAKQSLVLEGDSLDQKATCTYEGDFELLNADAQENDDVECVLIYDHENKAFVVERLASSVAVRSGAPSGSSAPPAASGMLALPEKQHDPAGEQREEDEDEEEEDELAKELEGMLDDEDDFVDPPVSAARSTQSARRRRLPSPDDRLNMELEETLEKALLDDVPSDDDDFEEVDAAQFAAPSINNHGNLSDEDEDDMAFEEVNMPASARGSPGGLVHAKPPPPEDDLVIDDEDFEDFEEVGSPRTAQSSAFDDALFGDSVGSTPITGDSATDRLPPVSGSKSESVDEFDDLDFDLARNIEHS